MAHPAVHPGRLSGRHLQAQELLSDHTAHALSMVDGLASNETPPRRAMVSTTHPRQLPASRAMHKCGWSGSGNTRITGHETPHKPWHLVIGRLVLALALFGSARFRLRRRLGLQRRRPGLALAGRRLLFCRQPLLRLRKSLQSLPPAEARSTKACLMSSDCDVISCPVAAALCAGARERRRNDWPAGVRCNRICQAASVPRMLP
jgi:hypothetical protein